MDNVTIIEVNAFPVLVVEIPGEAVENDGIFDETFDETFE